MPRQPSSKSGFAHRRDFLRDASLALSGVLLCNSNIAAAKKPILPQVGVDRSTLMGALPTLQYDVVVYGGTAAGVMAAYATKMYGLHTLLIEPGRHIGGMTSGGLGATDTGGEDEYITGLSQEFYLRLGQYYGQQGPVYRFEPHVAELILKEYLDEAGVEVLFSRRLQAVETENDSINSMTLAYSEDASKQAVQVSAYQFIDATYEGDLMAQSGVSYTTGRESNSIYQEIYNGVIPGREAGPYGETVRTREWGADVDPYVVPGKPSSGLLPEVNGIGHAAIGTGDDKIQAYCFRLCLTQDRKNQIPLQEPEGYDPYRYELLARLQALKPWTRLRNGFNIAMMPNGKTDINNYGLVGFSSNYVGGNYDYPEGDYLTRSEVWQAHKVYQQGLWWFLGTDERVPKVVRDEVHSWGYCRDEFRNTQGWPHQLYIREARRMVSDFVMTEHECVGHRPVRDGIAKGGYALDSHVVQRVVVNDHVENEGNISVKGFDPYLISYRSIIPKEGEIDNLYVPVCVSASHAAYGSLRMEPVFMALGHAAGVAASLAMKKSKAAQQVPVSSIQGELRDNPLVNRKVPDGLADILSFRTE
ncbi:MAG: FAD-dependent oxidoreductase [Saprospiraceae bacterium]|nr:FAD-dependent oxidoreductase [Saprospiraceae bacterium]